jgi:hypothetical protein
MNSSDRHFDTKYHQYLQNELSSWNSISAVRARMGCKQSRDCISTLYGIAGTNAFIPPYLEDNRLNATSKAKQYIDKYHESIAGNVAVPLKIPSNWSSDHMSNGGSSDNSNNDSNDDSNASPFELLEKLINELSEDSPCELSTALPTGIRTLTIVSNYQQSGMSTIPIFCDKCYTYAGFVAYTESDNTSTRYDTVNNNNVDSDAEINVTYTIQYRNINAYMKRVLQLVEMSMFMSNSLSLSLHNIQDECINGAIIYELTNKYVVTITTDRIIIRS